jgi:hypothetical protein
MKLLDLILVLQLLYGLVQVYLLIVNTLTCQFKMMKVRTHS